MVFVEGLKGVGDIVMAASRPLVVEKTTAVEVVELVLAKNSNGISGYSSSSSSSRISWSIKSMRSSSSCCCGHSSSSRSCCCGCSRSSSSSSSCCCSGLSSSSGTGGSFDDRSNTS